MIYSINFCWEYTKIARKIQLLDLSKLGLSKKEWGLRFRELESFNLAMLSKQGWKLIQQPHSLVSSILKQKYFLSFDFLQTKIGTKFSYVWKSITAGRELLKKGFIWRVKNGKSINI